MQPKKPKDNIVVKPVSKLGHASDSKGHNLFKPEGKQETEMYNPFEPTVEPVVETNPRGLKKKLKKKRKS